MTFRLNVLIDRDFHFRCILISNRFEEIRRKNSTELSAKVTIEDKFLIMTKLLLEKTSNSIRFQRLDHIFLEVLWSTFVFREFLTEKKTCRSIFHWKISFGFFFTEKVRRTTNRIQEEIHNIVERSLERVTFYLTNICAFLLTIDRKFLKKIEKRNKMKINKRRCRSTDLHQHDWTPFVSMRWATRRVRVCFQFEKDIFHLQIEKEIDLSMMIKQKKTTFLLSTWISMIDESSSNSLIKHVGKSLIQSRNFPSFFNERKSNALSQSIRQ